MRSTTTMHDTGSRNRLTPHQLGLYPGDTLFDRLARVVCSVGKLPRKELHEAWEVARRVRRRFRGGRVIDLCCGHGLLAHVMLLIDDTSPTAIALDRRIPDSARPLQDAMVTAWPRLAGRVELRQCDIEELELTADDVVVSAHACGGLTDTILQRAMDVHARVAVLPCCHAHRTHGDLDGWLEPGLALDVERASRLRAAGYDIWTQSIPVEVTPKNRLLLGLPHARVSTST
jgi:hypothetical protein